MKTIVKILLITSLLALLTCASYAAEKPYEGITINVIAQPRPEWDLIQKDIPTLEQETGMKINIRYFDELERRSKERLDASMGTGSYQVYYLDEANIPEFGNAGWVYPIKDYFPEKYDFND
ncbi:MAG: sugar ABC transporter substrate-binding protein, partial [Atribacterota bacterium]